MQLNSKQTGRFPLLCHVTLLNLVQVKMPSCTCLLCCWESRWLQNNEIHICGDADSPKYYWCLASQQFNITPPRLDLIFAIVISSLSVQCLASSASTYLYWHGGGGIIIIVSDCDPSTEREMLGGKKRHPSWTCLCLSHCLPPWYLKHVNYC